MAKVAPRTVSASIACVGLHNGADSDQGVAVREGHAVCVGVLAPVACLGHPGDEAAVDVDATLARWS